MKLLLDENLSDRIISRIGDLFPDSTHIKAVGLKEADDFDVWEWAKKHGFTIVSKDTDFHHFDERDEEQRGVHREIANLESKIETLEATVSSPQGKVSSLETQLTVSSPISRHIQTCNQSRTPPARNLPSILAGTVPHSQWLPFIRLID